MTLEDLKADLSERLGRKVVDLQTRDGDPVTQMEDLYQPSPAGFAGRLSLRNGARFAWELWLEDGDHWNFQATPLNPSN